MTNAERLAELNTAISQIETQGQSYSMKSTSVTRASLATLYAERRQLQQQIAAEHSNFGISVAYYEGR